MNKNSVIFNAPMERDRVERLNSSKPLKNYLIVDKNLIDEFFNLIDDNDFKEKFTSNFNFSSTYYITKTELQFKRNSSFMNGDLYTLGAIDDNGVLEAALLDNDKIKMQKILMKKYLPYKTPKV